MAGYQPVPYVRGSTLGELARRRDYLRAEALRDQGQRTADAWGIAGRTLGSIFSNIAEERRQAPILAAKAEAERLKAADEAATRKAKQEQAEKAQQFKSYWASLPADAQPDERALMTIDPVEGAKQYGDWMQRRQQEADRRQAQNKLGVQRQVFEAIGMRAGQPMDDATRQLLVSAAGQEGISVPESAFPARPEAPKPPATIDAAILAAEQRGDAAAVKRLLGLKARIEAAGRAPAASGGSVSLQTREVVDERGQRVMANFNPSTGQWTRPDGSVIASPKPSSGTSKPASGLEKRALNFFNRAQQADMDLESMEADVAKMGLAGQTYMEWAPNFAQTDIGQRYTQAQRAFTEARLRKDSGAAIPKEEFANDRQTYFAQPGDSPATLEQKRRARGAMLASLAFESGQALGEFVGDADEARRIVDSYKTRAAKTQDAVPKVGDVKTFPNGRRGRWDGQGYEPIP